MIIVLWTLLAAPVGIVAGAYAWGLRNGTVAESTQERIDREFLAITRRLRGQDRR